MVKIDGLSDHFEVTSGTVRRIGSDKGAAEIRLDLSNGNMTTLKLPGVSPETVVAFLGSDQPGTPVLLLSRLGWSIGIGKEDTGVWLTTFRGGF
jgi:hypothetical protein